MKDKIKAYYRARKGETVLIHEYTSERADRDSGRIVSHGEAMVLFHNGLCIRQNGKCNHISPGRILEVGIDNG